VKRLIHACSVGYVPAWILLILAPPLKPNAVRVCRALKATGCATLRHGAYLLPAQAPQAHEFAAVVADADYCELVGDDDGVFGCMSLLACHDVCPKNLPLATQIAFVQRAMVEQRLEWNPPCAPLRKGGDPACDAPAPF
jgi:hypothetical protein